MKVYIYNKFLIIFLTMLIFSNNFVLAIENTKPKFNLFKREKNEVKLEKSKKINELK